MTTDEEAISARSDHLSECFSFGAFQRLGFHSALSPKRDQGLARCCQGVRGGAKMIFALPKGPDGLT